MKTNYLFPNKFKKLGWAILIPVTVFGILDLFFDYEPQFLNVDVLSLFGSGFGKNHFFEIIQNNIFNEILGILMIVSGLLVAFSKEKVEDEFIAKIRLESLVWSVYVNYGILLIALIFIYGIPFLWVMIVNIFTILLIFIIRFNIQISRLKKSAAHEE